MNELKLLLPPRRYIVHGVQTTTGVRYAVRTLETWFKTDFRAISYVDSTDCENAAKQAVERLNQGIVPVYRPAAHPPREIPTTASAHIQSSKERYYERNPYGLW